MTTRISLHSPWPWWVVVIFVLTYGAPVALHAQSGPAKYLGGTLTASGRNLHVYKASAVDGTISTRSDTDLEFGDGKSTSITIPYAMITALKYGLDPGHRGLYRFPWDSYVQFTKKRHYLLTIVFQPPQDKVEQSVVFELDRRVVKPTLDQLQLRSGKQVEFTEAVACTQYKMPNECGHGQPAELRGLTKVFIETRSAGRELIASEIAAAALGLTILEEAQGAEIVLRYMGALVAETSYGEFGANRGNPMEAGRGEVHVVREGQSRVVLMFEDIKMSPLQRHPATNFARAFLEAYMKAATGAKRQP